jgi:hypothetical protein
MLLLSEAILLGRMEMEYPLRAGNTKHCAIGMALLANGFSVLGNVIPSEIPCHPLSITYGTDSQRDVHMLLALYPWLIRIHVHCPFGHGCNEELCEESIVYHPFDRHVMKGHITLDQMCDWLATMEPNYLRWKLDFKKFKKRVEAR